MCTDHTHGHPVHDHEAHGSHDHTHGHTHHHDHHSPGETSAEDRDLKILQYMIAHNAEHAREMRELADRLRGTGKAEAADLIINGAEGFETANAELEKAAELMS